MIQYQKFYLVCGFSMFASEIWKQLTLTFHINNGTYNWWYFPFQLCSIPMYICILLPLVKNQMIRRTFLAFLMDFGLLGGIFVFFDTSGMQYDYFPLTVHSYMWHILLIIIGVTAGRSKDSDYSFNSYLKSASLYGTGCFIATILNLTLHKYGTINMFYISPFYQMSQKVFNEIARSLGNTAGIIIYILAIAAGAGIFHFLWYIGRYLQKAFSKSAVFIGRPK